MAAAAAGTDRGGSSRWVPRPYKRVVACADLHGDIEVLLGVLRHVGLAFNPEASTVDTFVNWSDNVQDTVLVVCGDIIDRNRGGWDPADTKGETTVYSDYQSPRLLYSAQHKKYFVLMGTNGEQPLEEQLILHVLLHLHNTANVNGRNNKVIVTAGNHDVVLMVEGKTLSEFTTDMARWEETALDHDSVARDQHYEDARAKWHEFASLSDAQRGQIFAGAVRVDYHGPEVNYSIPAPRLRLRRLFADCRPFVYAFWSMGHVLFSHAGFTAETRQLWKRYGVTDPNALLRELLALPSWNLATIAGLLTNPANANQLLHELRLMDANPFWLRTTAEDFLTPIMDLHELGLEQHVPITTNVLGHNCNNINRYPAHLQQHVIMLDHCASRGVAETAQYPNGPTRILTYETSLDPTNLQYVLSKPQITELPPLQGNVRTVPLLREQLGCVIVADYEPAPARTWRVRLPPPPSGLATAVLDSAFMHKEEIDLDDEGEGPF